MIPSDRSARASAEADALIDESEALRHELVAEVERLETFVQALQAAVDLREVRRDEQA